jgi:hypothetical protein
MARRTAPLSRPPLSRVLKNTPTLSTPRFVAPSPNAIVIY